MSNPHTYPGPQALPDLERLQQYLEGTLPPEEAAAIEAQAGEDPVLADMLEGMAAVGSLELAQQTVSRIREQSRSRLYLRLRGKEDKSSKRQSRVKPTLNWQMAASLAAGLAILVVTFWLIGRRPPIQQGVSDAVLADHSPRTETSAENPQLLPLAADSLAESSETTSAPPPPAPHAQAREAEPSTGEAELAERALAQQLAVEKQRQARSRPQASAGTSPVSSVTGAPPPPAKPAAAVDPSSLPASSAPADAITKGDAQPLAEAEEDEGAEFSSDTVGAIFSNADDITLEAGKANAVRDYSRKMESAKKQRYTKSEMQKPVQDSLDRVMGMRSKQKAIDGLYTRALVLYANGAHVAAADSFRQILLTTPQHPGANYYLGTILRQDQQFREATVYLNNAVAAPEASLQENARWELALTYIATGKKRKARRLLREISDTPGRYQLEARKKMTDLEE